MNGIPAHKPAGAAALAFPYPDVPAPGCTIEVAPGIRWLRMPLPFALDHINLWLLADGEGWTIVDTGFGRGEETRRLWDQVFAATLGGRPVTRVIVTHFHPDHMGLAGWLCERFGVELWTPQAEWLTAHLVRQGWSGGDVEKRVQHYRRNGLPVEQLDAFRQRGNTYAGSVSPVPVTFHRIMEGDEIMIDGRPWRVIIGQGHAPEHACLYSRELDVLISGDQVLPKITTNVSVWPDQPESNPLKLYLDSLAHFRPLPASALVLPSHGLPFHGLHARLEQLAHHHDERLARTLEACAAPRTGAEIIPVLFRRQLDLHQLSFAIGEALAHLHYLVGRGELHRETGSDGVHRFVRT
ncbi:MAG TPA: MBL fold metallo-hydrolase [Alphaproteobacteria bacterium]|nr:MBL fold metallo-hydrolase [Alphaproteobacteria bacterium]